MSIACQCASIRPGMSVRPPPSMSVVVALRPVGIGLVETRSILFPRTRTFLGPDRAVLFPSKIRTFRNSVTASPDGVEGLAPGASCAWPAWQRLSRNATNTNGRYCVRSGLRVMSANLQITPGPLDAQRELSRPVYLGDAGLCSAEPGLAEKP